MQTALSYCNVQIR